MFDRWRLFYGYLVPIVLSSCFFVEFPASADEFVDALSKPLLQPDEARRQHANFVLKRIPELKLPATADDWAQRAAELRTQVLHDVVFRGVPEEWYTAEPEIVWMDEIATPYGYSIKKLRYEALPGFWIPAVLYVPDNIEGQVPVVLNVNGHTADGKSTDYKQLRCINLAKQGMIALNPEWLFMGQLRQPGYAHNNIAFLDLCGTSGLSVFYLAMSRGIDVLLSLENADEERIAVTGLSGGGWQTIILSSLDERVTLSVPVAGYSALAERVDHHGSVGDLEQNPSDLISIADYTHLTAMMVPRPTLQIYNDKDNCCFVSSHVKPNTYVPIVPFFEQAGAGECFEYYENSDPGTHNYDLDNRQQLYRFLNKHFFADDTDRNRQEIPSEKELKTAEELYVPVPDDNATFYSLAAHFSADLPHLLDATRDEQREFLRKLLRFNDRDATLEPLGEVETFDTHTVERFKVQIGDDWSISVAVIGGESIERTALLLADAGFKSQAEAIAAQVEMGTRIICFDPVNIGEMQPLRIPYQGAMLLATVGERPLGVQAQQIQCVAAAVGKRYGTKTVDVVSVGPRTSLAALCAAAIDETSLFGALKPTGLPSSLKAFLQPDASYDKTPEVYCFGLLQHFDIEQLQLLRVKDR
ncbi:MAG: acetylxylan esterase [Planctomycetota bacterium]|nr:acetylxylan esterase [Planctomycetota bacterium]